MVETVYLGLGSSLGDRVAHLRNACTALRALCADPTLFVAATVYETPHMRLNPADTTLYPDHLNTVVRLETELAPEALLEAIHEIERNCGRIREAGQRWQPRTLDIDILLFGDRQLHTSSLVVPHPGIADRRFVLQPLLDLLPDYRLADGRLASERLADPEILSQTIKSTAHADELLL